VIAAIALIQWLADVRSFGDSALLVALYTVAATQPLRTTLVAAGVVETGVALATARWAGPHWQEAFVGLTGMATAAAVLGINVRHRRAALTLLQERAARLEYERDQRGRLAAAAERSRIAREMHDIVAHNLSVIIALADGASFAVHDAPDRAEVAMRTASRTGRQALNEMRRLLGVLREEQSPRELTPQPGIDEIDQLIEQVRSAGLPVRHDVTGLAPEPLPAGLQLATYRIVQEALTNTLKHAGLGADARVALTFEAAGVQIEVTDSGPERWPAATEGVGLRGMRERAAVYDGVVEAGPLEGGGWRVRARLTSAAVPAQAVPA
ncbi:MAG TPA: histidine kinase, partial [Solirubrobacteraceae bacterium]|nr:histidine kinase [Solirubrobacteraceae bacterium]